MPVLDALPPTLIVQRVLDRHVEINRMVAVGYPWSSPEVKGDAGELAADVDALP
ncbi:hypothetical protein ABZZ74_47475 [Streptomyces sp. NPDC006476]|uniref:hypothetical protein n=1 Tax=Streptomyces sp. NPDC006476 TaxID=3157175 RepID=UPI0033B28CD5